jgi:hypothetical protein
MLMPEQREYDLLLPSGLWLKIHPSFTDQQQLYSRSNCSDDQPWA